MSPLSCIRTSVATLVLALVLMPLTLFAATEKPAQLKGQWAVGMIQAEKGVFAYCLARAPYNNGLQLAIALSGKHEVNVGVVVPDAGFNVGDRYPMAVSIDAGLRREHAGLAPQPELVMMPLGSDAAVLAALKKGKVLSIEGPEDIATFSLKGSGPAFTSLQQCVDIGTGKIKAPKAQKVAAGKGKGAAFPPTLLQMLKAAGLKNLQIVQVDDPQHSPVDFAWRTDGAMGGLRERPLPEDVTLEKMSSVIEDSYRQQCKGMFTISFSTPEELSGVRLRTADVTCQMEGKVSQLALLLYLTDTHLFSMFMHEATEGQKDKAVNARNAIAGEIRKLAKQQKPSVAPAAPPAARTPAPAASAPPAAAPEPKGK